MGPAQMHRIAKALADKRRFELLSAISTCKDTPCRSLVRRFPISQATVSHHLKELVAAGLVEVHQEGQARFYCLRKAVLAEYLDAVKEKLGCEEAGVKR